MEFWEGIFNHGDCRYNQSVTVEGELLDVALRVSLQCNSQQSSVQVQVQAVHAVHCPGEKAQLPNRMGVNLLKAIVSVRSRLTFNDQKWRGFRSS